MKKIVYFLVFLSISLSAYSIWISFDSKGDFERLPKLEADLAKEIWFNREIHFTLIDEVARMDRVKFDSLMVVNRYRRYLTDLSWREKSLQDSLKKYPSDTMYAAQYMIVKAELDKYRE